MRALAWALALVLGAGCFQDSTPQHTTFLPVGWRSDTANIRLVRACRLNVQHEGNYQQVYVTTANQADAQYLAQDFPLPAGSVVVAEQHKEQTCNSLASIDLMVKETPGYDPANHDWHWQTLDANERVVQDGHLVACSSCHAACNDYLCGR